MGLITYERLVEQAGERAAASGHLDLCDLSTALTLGFHYDTFIADVEAHIRTSEKDDTHG